MMFIYMGRIFAFVHIYVSFVSAQNYCDNWESYETEKCFKILSEENTITFQGAVDGCNSDSGSTLLTIHTKKELDYITKYLIETKKVVENVWLGLNTTNKKLQWVDGTAVDFTNWESGSPSNQSDQNCTELLIDKDSKLLGKWRTLECKKKNLVVCERAPNIPPAMAQKLLTQMMRELSDTKTKLQDYMSKSLNKNYFHLSYFIDSDGKNKEFIFPLEENLKALVWDESKKACAKYNASLVEVKSAHKQQILELFLGQLGYQSEYMNCFMLNAKKDVSGKFKWQKSGQDVVFNKWAPNNPISEVGKDYLLAYTSKTYFGKWQNTYNNTPCYTLCEQEVLV